MTLLTTTVSVDAQKVDYSQAVINLVQGDVGTRRFQMVPISGGIPISLADVASAKIQAVNMGGDPLLINCVITSGKIYMEPPTALVQYASEWQCQLVLLDDENQTLHSMRFTIIVHNAVYTGDTVEHTNVAVTGVEWDQTNQKLIIHLADGTSFYCGPLTHSHSLATASNNGFMASSHFNNLATLWGWNNQNLRSDYAVGPSFQKLTVGDVTIFNTGVVTGIRFT